MDYEDIKAKCPVCNRPVFSWEMSVMEDGVWIIEACDYCVDYSEPLPELRQQAAAEISPEAHETGSGPGSQLNLFGGEE